MNIIEAYIKFNKQLVIIISGMNGSGKNTAAKNISKLFKLELIDLHDYINDNFSNIIKLPDGTNYNNINTNELYDWSKFNKYVNDNKYKGLIITGELFPEDYTEFNFDYHIQIKLSKKNLFNRRIYNLKKKGIDIYVKREKYIFNEFTYPYYLNETEKSEINKFINANNLTNLNNDEYNEIIYDLCYDYLIKYIESKLYS